MMKLIASPVRQRKCLVAVPDAGEIRRQIRQPVRNQMHDIPFPLDAAIDAEHAGTEHDAAIFLEGLYPDDETAFCDVSSIAL